MKLVPLILIELVAFLLIVVESFIFFDYVVPVGVVPHSFAGYTLLAILKLGLTFSLGVLWFVVILSLTEVYVKAHPVPPTPTSLS